MESLADAEVLELIFLANEMIDAQFQYWLAASMAAIVATFIGGEYLTRAMRVVMVVLYLLASLFFALKYFATQVWLLPLGEAAFGRGLVPEVSLALQIILVRGAIYFGGVGATVWFLLVAKRDGDDA